MTTTDLTPEQRLTVVKHLAGGKGLDVVATLTQLDRSTVLDIGSNHGYPDTEKLGWAVDVLAKKLTEDAAPKEHPHAREIAAGEARRPVPTVTSSSTGGNLGAASTNVVTRPDDIRVLLKGAQEHPSKRVQGAAEKALDAIARVRTLLREDEEKHAEKRRAHAQKAAAKAEIERLTRELAAAREKLRGPKPKATTLTVDGSVTSAEIRTWARANKVDVPAVGRVPDAVRKAYDEAHQAAS